MTVLRFPVERTTEPYIDKATLAGLLGRTTRTIEVWMTEGLPHHKPLRRRNARVMFRYSEVCDWIEGR